MLFLFLACTPEAPSSSPDEAETEWIADIEVATSARIPTALEVRFSSAEEAQGWVEFGVGGADAFTSPLTVVGTEHVAAVIGNPALTEVTMRVVIEVDGTRHESGTFTAETGQNLPETPIAEVMLNNYTDPPEGMQLLMSLFGSVTYLVMMDLEGNITWSLPQGVADTLGGLGVEPVENGIRYNLFEVGKGAAGTLEHIDLLGNPISTVETDDAHHFFTIGPQEELVWLEHDLRVLNGSEIAGDVVMQRDSSGAESTLFSHWDSFTLPQSNQAFIDWTHANWIDWDPDRGSYLLSNAFTNTIAELDADGAPVRIMGGPGAVDSEYIFDRFESAFEYPHGPHWTDNGDLLVFSTVDKVSRVSRYTVDDELMIMTEVWSYGAEYAYEALWLGETQELPDGNILISWGSVGLLQIVSPSGELLWEAAAPFQSFFNQVHPMRDPYTPWR